MSTTYMDSKTSIRRRGAVVTFSNHDHDGSWNARSSGTRRDLQIGKRHWVKKSECWWSSGGGAGEEVSVKTPGKEVGLLYQKTWD